MGTKVFVGNMSFDTTREELQELFAQALSCAYYAIFAGLMVGLATLFFAVTRGLWRSPRYWTARRCSGSTPSRDARSRRPAA